MAALTKRMRDDLCRRLELAKRQRSDIVVTRYELELLLEALNQEET